MQSIAEMLSFDPAETEFFLHLCVRLDGIARTHWNGVLEQAKREQERKNAGKGRRVLSSRR